MPIEFNCFFGIILHFVKLIIPYSIYLSSYIIDRVKHIIDKIYQQAKSSTKKIILVEPEDDRIVKACQIATKEKIADITLLDTPPKKHPLFDQFVNQFYELRKEKGISIDQAKEIISHPLYFGTMMVKNNIVDGMVAGANNTSLETFRPALQIIKTRPGESVASSFFIMQVPDSNFGYQGTYIFSDCGLNIDPTSEQLSQIAYQSAQSFQQLIGATPKIAMLSFSTNGSGSGESVDKVKKATEIFKQNYPEFIIEGEVQSDAAIIPDIANKKNPNSQLKGQANILIFPNLDAGNIAYKLVERLGHAQAFGPLLQGVNQPVNDLSRGCSVEDIVATIAITSVQATSNSLSK